MGLFTEVKIRGFIWGAGRVQAEFTGELDRSTHVSESQRYRQEIREKGNSKAGKVKNEVEV